MERAGYYYKNWAELEAKWEVKMKAIIKEIEELPIPRLPDLEDLSVVTDGVGESKGFHLLKAYDELINLGIQCWQYHFEFLNLAMPLMSSSWISCRSFSRAFRCNGSPR